MATNASPQPLVVGELIPRTKNPNPNLTLQISYAARLKQQPAIQNMPISKLKPIEFLRGEPILRFDMEERLEFA